MTNRVKRVALLACLASAIVFSARLSVDGPLTVVTTARADTPACTLACAWLDSLIRAAVESTLIAYGIALSSDTLYADVVRYEHETDVDSAVQAQLDAALSSYGVSTLTTADNIGINWDDVANQGASVNLSGTQLGLVNLLGTNAITAAAIEGSAARELADTLLNRDTAGTVFDNGWSFGRTVQAAREYAQQVRDTVNDHAPHDNNFGAAAGSDCSGGGAYPCTVYVVKTVLDDTVALQGVFLRVYNSDETATAATGVSDANGRVIFALDADTFHVYGYQGGLFFAPQPEIVVVTPAGVTDTAWATAFDPGSPAEPDLCRVYGWVSDLTAGTVEGASVLARIVASPLRHGNLIVSPYQVASTSDSTGYWALDVFPSETLDPAGTKYEFEIRLGSGAILRRTVAVPDSATWFFTW